MSEILSVKSLFSYKFEREEELGFKQERYNGGIRYDVLSDRSASIVKSPQKLIRLLRYLEVKHGHTPAYGIKNRRTCVPFMIGSRVGVFYFAQEKVVNITQLIHIQKAIDDFGLEAVIIYGHNFSKPVLESIKRMRKLGNNIELNYLNSIIKKID